MFHCFVAEHTILQQFGFSFWQSNSLEFVLSIFDSNFHGPDVVRKEMKNMKFVFSANLYIVICITLRTVTIKIRLKILLIDR